MARSSFVRSSPSGLTAGIASLRHIEPGEEITISYFAQGMTFDERQKLLKHWRFNCTYTLCTMAPGEIVASDERRQRIRKIAPETITAIRSNNLNMATELEEEAVELLNTEGLATLLRPWYDGLSVLHWVLENTAAAYKYALLVADFRAYYESHEPRDRASDLEEVLQRYRL
ncbi:hypothetical protein BR93DRAFT_975237 [Coniochaeta sp. PMI_546]|nr:hypothetical protein BR93DRAFT_975237 [Coniochaeta sp. PMI_546]